MMDATSSHEPIADHSPRTAIVLFNLGGPDRPEAVRPFLKNLFTDPAILRVPFFIRPFLARWIARARLPAARANYAYLGGKSPLLELTERQAAALQDRFPKPSRVFIAMRYWHPFSDETARLVAAWKPDQVLLLPLYPQFSTTTTASSLTVWREAAARAGLAAPVTTLCCWPEDPGYIAATTALIQKTIAEARARLAPGTPLRLLFSAHGLPEVIIAGGDPYQNHVEATANAVAAALDMKGLDWRVCYQSRATPQKWLDPSTEAEIERAGRDGVALVVAPIAFVSDHSETLVELDIEYAEVAKKHHVPGYFRVPAQNDDPGFIAALGALAKAALARGPGLCSHRGGRVCDARYHNCPLGDHS
jgi:ferrochelatase